MYHKNYNGLCRKNLHKWILYPQSTLYSEKSVTCWDKSVDALIVGIENFNPSDWLYMSPVVFMNTLTLISIV